jgi:tetraacyldisaccharide 4'-kinase
VRRGIEGAFRRYWHDEAGLAPRVALTALTAPLSALFGVGVRLRNRAYDTGLLPVRSAPVPVLSVGNLSVGGTGKTPVTRWLVARLLAAGRHPAVVSRGYGPDELALHRRWHPQVPVVAHPDRVVAAREAAAQGADVLVLDDGFQHRALARDADLLLVGALDPFPPRLLPRGPYREPLASVGRAQLVLVTTRGGDDATGRERAAALRRLPRHPPVDVLRLVAAGWQTLEGAPASPPEPDEPLLVVTSVAQPDGVIQTLRQAGAGGGGGEGLELLAFPDHHPYDAADLRRVASAAGGRRLVTTEKDAVKLAPLAHLLPTDPEPRVVTLEVAADPPAERLVDRLIDRALARGTAGSGA